MKNYLSILVFILLFVYSCDKQNQTSEILTPSTQERNFLVFDNTEKFDAALSDQEITKTSIANATNFNSFLTKFNTLKQGDMLALEGLEDFAADDNFIQLLNEHQMVQIGTWICQLDFKAKEVYVLHESKWDKVKNYNISNATNAYTFLFDDEVSTYMDVALTEDVDLNEAKDIYVAASYGANTAARGVCPSVSDKKKEKDKCSDLQYTSGIDGKTYSAKVKLVYQKAGIYFSVKAQLKNYRTWVGCNLNTQGLQSIAYGNVVINRKKWKYKRFKRVCQDYYIGGNFSYTTQVEGGSYDVDNSAAILRNKLYEGTRGLQDLDVTAEFNWASHRGGTSAHFVTFNIRK